LLFRSPRWFTGFQWSFHQYNVGRLLLECYWVRQQLRLVPLPEQQQWQCVQAQLRQARWVFRSLPQGLTI
ncbi:MAG: hypothetical protein ACKOZZ_05110, partial [Bacteroidota bacterium]